jgi:phage repressor protein C with HTH and peptisase S24 domain/DNA-binding transcriptional regulator YdaS (Cro superfamily)
MPNCAKYAQDFSKVRLHGAPMDTAWFKTRKKALRLTDDDVAAALGVERSVANKVVNGHVSIDARRISALARLFEVPTAEIMRRAGIDYSASDGEASPPAPRPLDIGRAPDQPPTVGSHDDIGSVQLRRVNMGLAMGDGSNLDDFFEEGTASFDANWLRAITASPPDRLVIADGIGDSMQPTIMDHDQVLIDLNQNRIDKGDRIWALAISGSGAVKRLFPAGGGMIEVMSDNPAHPNRVRNVGAEDIRVIGRVVWSGRRH